MRSRPDPESGMIITDLYDSTLDGEEMTESSMPKVITIGDKYGPAMEITEQAEADAYFERCVEHSMLFGKSRTEAEALERHNLGYYAGYYDGATRERVERLYRCSHPIFGAVATRGHPTAEEAFTIGRLIGS